MQTPTTPTPHHHKEQPQGQGQGQGEPYSEELTKQHIDCVGAATNFETLKDIEGFYDVLKILYRLTARELSA